MLRVFEAFAGVGAQRMALRNLGIEHEVVAISEIDKFAVNSYEVIHGKTTNLGDISKLVPESIPDHDLFTYSFPCQDISVAGKQAGLSAGSGTRSGLLWECQKVISAKKPKYLLLENVKNLVSKRHKADFDSWLEWLAEQGYSNYWKVLNAKEFGVPQNRERVFVLSIFGAHAPFSFPEGRPLKSCLQDFLEPHVEEKFYLPKEKLDALLVDASSVGVKCSGSKALIKNATKLGYLEAEAGDGIDVAYLTSTTRRGRVQKKCSPTLQTMDITATLEVLQSGTAEPEFRVRKLTPLECWRLMGFTDEDFYKAQAVNSNAQLYKQAGNSIVVEVLEGIFRQLFMKEIAVIKQEVA